MKKLSSNNSSARTSIESSSLLNSSSDKEPESVFQESILVLKTLDGKQILGLFSDTSLNMLSISNEGIDLLEFLIVKNFFHEMIYNLKAFLNS